MNPTASSRFELLRPQTTGPDPCGAGGDLEEPLPGTVCAQFVQCGKPNCRCRKGLPHGPYFYRIWRNGRTVEKVYVRASDVARVRRQCAQYHVLDEELRALRARRLAHTARLWAQIRRSRRLREGPFKQGLGLEPPYRLRAGGQGLQLPFLPPSAPGARPEDDDPRASGPA